MLVYKQVSFVWLSSRLSSPRTQRPTFAAWCWAASGEGYLALIQTDQGRRTGDPRSRAPRRGPGAFSVGVVKLLGISFFGVYIAIHASISIYTVPLLSASGANY